jgi:protocatechuate 3,4-dioxygenase beta subunit
MKKIIPGLIFVLFTGSCSFSQDADKTIAELDSKLSKGQITISAVLSDPKYMYLHSQTPFRQVIKKYAKAGKVKIITDAEPGQKITVKGIIEDADGKALIGALIYFYHTSDKGWYSDTAAHILVREGDMGHARLFGYLKTDNKGRFEFETIQARGYPRSDFPAHIHIMVWKDDKVVTGLPNELQFDDDPRMTPERKTRSLREGNLIEKNSGTATNPVYSYHIKLKT